MQISIIFGLLEQKLVRYLHCMSTSVQHSLTTKGLLAMARILRSFLTLSTMFLRIKSFLRITCNIMNV